MNIRFSTVASAVALAAAGTAPAFANEQAVAVQTAAPVLIADQSILAAASTTLPLTTTETELGGSELAGVLNAAVSESAPVTITAGSGAPLATATSATPAMVFDAAAVAAAVQASASTGTGRAEKFTVVLNQDSFFGFYPTFNALIPVNDKVDLSVYGIMWTTSDFSSQAGFSSDLWTEFGIGAAIYASDALVIKPQVGITNGALLSRGTITPANGGNFADGIVPSLTINYSDDKFEGEFYGGYYAALRNRTRDTGALDFLHTWINAGYKFTKNFSAGGHFEVLANTRVDLPGAGSSNVYQWYGPYVQFSLSNGFFTRLTGGVETGGGAGGNNGDFYKLAVGFSF